MFAKEDDKVAEEQPSENKDEENIEVHPPVNEEIKEENPNEEPKGEITEGNLDEDIMVKEEGVEYPEENIDEEQSTKANKILKKNGDV